MPVLTPPQTGLRGYVLYPMHTCASLGISVGTVRAYPSIYGTLPPAPSPANPNGSSNDFVFQTSYPAPFSAGDAVTFDLVQGTYAPYADNVQKA
jgi:hypothetical protein